MNSYTQDPDIQMKTFRRRLQVTSLHSLNEQHEILNIVNKEEFRKIKKNKKKANHYYKWSVRLIEILGCMQEFQILTEFSLEIYQTAKRCAT